MYGKGGGVTRIKVTGADFDEIRARILSAPDQVTQEIASAFEAVGAQAVEDMKQRIQDATTKTGQEQKRLGHRPTAGRVRGSSENSLKSRPRVAGRSMIDSVTYKVSTNRRSVSLRFGWLSGRPGYAFFQEYGTSNGVPAMHALTDARAKADIEIMRILRRI